MMNDTFASRLPWMLGSILAAMGLYVGVELTTVNKDTKENNYNVTTSYEDKPEGLAVVAYKGTVTVKAKGNADVLKNFDPANLKGIINLSNGKIGKYNYPVSIQGLPLGVRFEVPQVPVSLEAIERKEIPVRVEYIGSVPTSTGLMLESTDKQPERVIAVGPHHSLQSVEFGKVYLDLSKVELNKPYQVKPQMSRSDGSFVGEVRSEPPMVTLLPRLSPVPSNRLVLVVPAYRGHPLGGYRVSDVDVRPNQVSVTGDGQALSHAKTIYTAPIDLNGLRSDHTFVVSLQVPKGLKIEKGQGSVRVRISVEAVPELGTRANPNGPANQRQPLGP